MKRKGQLCGGGLSLVTGLALFIYFGTRTRPSSGDDVDPGLREQAFLHDLATIAGLGLLFVGVLLLILGAVGHWNEEHRNADEQSRI